jgi:hypothetical protein
MSTFSSRDRYLGEGREKNGWAIYPCRGKLLGQDEMLSQ